MDTVIIARIDYSNHGTFGYLMVNGELVGRTGEPPWRNNKPNLSCIPDGEYITEWHYSPRFGWGYIVTDVDGRSHILTHAGNFCGDSVQGLKTDTLGCILLGKYFGWLGNPAQKCVCVSKSTVRRFNKLMEKNPFKLIII